MCFQTKIEDTKGVIRSRKSKKTENTTVKTKRNTDLQNTTVKTKRNTDLQNTKTN